MLKEANKIKIEILNQIKKITNLKIKTKFRKTSIKKITSILNPRSTTRTTRTANLKETRITTIPLLTN